MQVDEANRILTHKTLKSHPVMIRARILSCTKCTQNQTRLINWLHILIEQNFNGPENYVQSLRQKL